MREIEFRAWDNFNKRMIQWDELREYKGLGEVLNPRIKVIGAPIITSVIQSTGLRDKYGAKIFEDDLCRAYGHRRNSSGLIRIVWNDESAQFLAVNAKETESVTHCFVADTARQMERIGNFYQNPQLLK